jgi:hypothetical protein
MKSFTRAEILEALALEPCHVTGMHRPNHHVEFTCDLQRAAAFKRVLALLGVEESELPRRLHDPPCRWCHGVPSQEEYTRGAQEAFKMAARRLLEAVGLPPREGA